MSCGLTVLVEVRDAEEEAGRVQRQRRRRRHWRSEQRGVDIGEEEGDGCRDQEWRRRKGMLG
jgi:hypothetical protein